MYSMFGEDSAEHGLEIYGICDGLVCLSLEVLKADSPIVLWNPVVRKGKKLPPIETGKHPYFDTCYLCFGYDDGDYKVISVVPYLQTLCHVHVYSLSTDQWKKSRIGNNNIGSPFYRRYRDMPFPARLVNGCAYFLEYPKTFGNDQVVAVIDLSHEIIRQIDVPHINDDHLFVFVKLGEHENRS
ncbi:F-box/kelch-repeat protein At3g06240 [Daucus carota subsp. sativus]|nr:PREDICTED: F-box/kelch-repeat protein At3g06240-like [Daucus carota subsp. sativus]